MEGEKKEQPAHVSAREETRDPVTTANMRVHSDISDNKKQETEADKAKEPLVTVASVETSYSDISVDQNASSELEPFPDYYESCGQYDQGDGSVNIIDKDHEAAYNYAISKVVEEVIRFKEIDASIISLASFTFNDNQNTSCAANKKTDKTQQSDMKDSETSSGKPSKDDACNIINDLKELLANPQLKLNIKKRFIAMTNMVLRMNVLLFHPMAVTEGIRQFLVDSRISEVKVLAAEILQYLAKIDQQLKEQVEDADRVASILSNLAQDNTVSVYVVFRRMAYVVIRNLRKPRPLERRLLTLFLELYDAYVYNSFLHLRNRQIMVEDDPNVERLELSRLLIALWDILNRVIENYEAYVIKMKEMKRVYFAPAMQQLQDSPEIWRECWMNHQLTIRPEEQPQFEPQSSKEPETGQADIKEPKMKPAVPSEDILSFSCHF